MALSVVGVGTASGSAGDATPTKHASTASGDLLLLAVEANANQSPASISGYTLVDSSTDPGAGSTSLAVWQRISDGTGTDNPTITDVGNHLYAVILTLRGQDGTTPIADSSNDREEVADTTGTCPAVTSTVDNSYVINFVATNEDNATPAWSGWTNGNLDFDGLGEQHEGGTTAGGGGGLAIHIGLDAVAGDSGTTTVTTPNDHKAFVTVAVSPDAGAGAQDVNPTGIATQEAFGTPTFTFGAVGIAPSGIATEEAFGVPTFISVFDLSPGSIASEEAFGTPSIAVGAVTVSPNGIATEEAFGAPSVTGGALVVDATGIPSEEAFGTPTFGMGTVVVNITGIPSEEAFGSPSVTNADAEAFVSVRMMMGLGP